MRHNVDLSTLANHEIAAIDPALIYMWVKTGKFSQKRFKEYLAAMQRVANCAGYEECLREELE
jgi:hypothetical protein